MNQYIKLWEYDKPTNIGLPMGSFPGVWSYKVTPGIVTVTDDYSLTGYYSDVNETVYNVKSFVANQIQYSEVSSISECETTQNSFYYNYSTTFIYIHFEEDASVFSFSEIYVGAVVGFSEGVTSVNKPYYNDIYYDPRISKIFNIKKSKDPLFYGLLKYSTGSVSCLNEDGYFDDWRDRNLFAQASRILIGHKDDPYEDFELVFQGLIENDSRSWDSFSVKLQDPRKGLTQSIATNLLTQTSYPSLNDENVDIPKPIKYGEQINSPCICLNETASGGSHTFLLCDTEFNPVGSLTATNVFVDGVASSAANIDLTAGTFTLTTGQVGGSYDNVTATFNATESSLQNGVDIIKDLMYRYDNKTYSSTFWDTTEVDAAEALSRNTSVSVDDDKKLKDVLQQVCVDIDALFFFKDTGVYTIRIYDENRAVTKIIKQDEWLDDPKIDNNGSEFLSSIIIKYNHDITEDKHQQYENLEYKEEVFDIYKTYKTTTIETNLTSLADAQEKSESVMSISKLVGDIVTRSIPYSTDIEIMDFIVGASTTRPLTKKGVSITPIYEKYEVLGIQKNLSKFANKLTLRYIEPYDMPIDTVYSVLIDESGNFIIDESGNTILMR